MHPQLPTTFVYEEYVFESEFLGKQWLKKPCRNNTWSSWLWSLWLRFPARIRMTAYHLFWRYLGPRQSPTVRKLPFGAFVKVSDSQEEPLATEFVRLNTTIPVPKVLDVLPYPYGNPILGFKQMFVTKCIPGIPLSESPNFKLDTAMPEQKEIFQRTLYDWLSQLRNIPSPHSEKVCSFNGGPLLSFRIDSSKERVGPFSDVKEFHAQNFNTAYPNYPDEADEHTKRLILERPSKRYQICLSHGDLQTHNILIDENGRPCGLIDWETASWMPEYWEHIVVIRMFIRRYPPWANLWREMFPQYEDDICIEQQIAKWYFP